jgi:hypothetical protein
MQIALSVTFAEPGEASTFMTALADALVKMKAAFTAAVPDLPAPPSVAEAPRKRGRSSKAGEPTPAVEPALDFDGPAAGPAAPVPTIEEIRTAGNELATAKGGNAVLEILKKYGVQRYPQLPEDRRAEALADLKRALEG